MNICQIKEEHLCDLKSLKYYMEQLTKLKAKHENPKVANISNEPKGGKRTDLSDYVAQVIYFETKIKEYDNKISDRKPFIDELEAIFKEFNDRDQQIYLEHYLRGYSMVNIGVKYSIDTSTVWRIIKKVEESLQNAISCNTR